MRKLNRECKTYETWVSTAQELDALFGKAEWKLSGKSPYLDSILLKDLLRRFETSKREGNLNELMDLLEIACHANIAGMDNEQLYAQTYYGTLKLIENFVDEVELCIGLIRASNSVSIETKRSFFRRLAELHGKTALCLSGGSANAFYHLGVIKCLMEHNALPNIITGTSAGALIAAILCIRCNDELQEIYDPRFSRKLKFLNEGILTQMKRFMMQGYVFDEKLIERNIQKFLGGPITFLEAYRKTGRILNITIVPDQRRGLPKLLNYKVSPNVVISSAVLASASIPGLLAPINLVKKGRDGTLQAYTDIGMRWRDGSLKSDIPIIPLHHLFNANYTIVSQVNPHVILFFFGNRGTGGTPLSYREGRGWRGGFIFSTIEHLLKLDMMKWLRLLRDLDLFPSIMNTEWSFVFLQKFYGTVTIAPRPSFWDYLHLFRDPTNATLSHYIKRGEHFTRPKLSMIQNRMRIESAIHQSTSMSST